LDADGFENRIEGGSKLCVAIVEQVVATTKEAGVCQGHLPGHWFRPWLVGGHSSDADLTRSDSHDCLNIIRDEPASGPNFGGEKVHGGQDMSV